MLDFKRLSAADKAFIKWQKMSFSSDIRVGMSLLRDDPKEQWTKLSDEEQALIDSAFDASMGLKTRFSFENIPPEVSQKVSNIIDILRYKTPIRSVADIADMLIGANLFYEYIKDYKKLSYEFLEAVIKYYLPIKIRALEIAMRLKDSEERALALSMSLTGNLNVILHIGDARILAFILKCMQLELGEDATKIFYHYIERTYNIQSHELVAMDDDEDILEYLKRLNVSDDSSSHDIENALDLDIKRLQKDPSVLAKASLDHTIPREINNSIVIGSNFDMQDVDAIKTILHELTYLSKDTVHDYFGNDMNPEFSLTPEMLAYVKKDDTPIIMIIRQEADAPTMTVMRDKKDEDFLLFRDPANVACLYGISLHPNDGDKRRCLRTLIPKDKEVKLEMGDVFDE